MKIAVYTITKNEEQFVKRWAESCKEADYRLIVDTGSTDNTLQEAKDAGCHVASVVINPWRFDDARNAALALLPKDIDMCVSLDADEVLMPGWREHLEALPPNVTRPRYKYVWSWNPDGTEGIVFLRDHIHKRHGYRWKHPVHEVVVPTGDEVQAFCALEVHHHADGTKSRGQYLPLLELSVKEDPDDDRNVFYLGREYMFYNVPDKAIPLFLKHLELSTWGAERATSMRYLGKATGNKEHWFLRACAEASERREPWVDLGFFYYEIQNWPGAYSACMRALSIVEKPLEYLCEPESWGSLPHDIASVAAWNLGIKDAALMHTLNAVRLSPQDSRIRANAAMIYGNTRKTKVVAVIPSKSNMDGLLSVVKQLKGEASVEKVRIVADGNAAYGKIYNLIADNGLLDFCDLLCVIQGQGIHAMWNYGAENSDGRHVLYINDDVTFDSGAIDVLAGMLDNHLELGVVCPNYDGRLIADKYQSVDKACPGNYDGTDGLAGFCFMLRSDINSEWRFDERMKWYYGDNDIVNWVRMLGKVAAISGIAVMQLNPSWTKINDPPSGFDDCTRNDALIFAAKWNDDGSLR